MPKPILIATRGSALALAQANTVLACCRAALPGETVELRVIKTAGDKLQTASLAGAVLPKGLFTKELEVALAHGEADLAVHSLKDLPTDLPDGLLLGATLPRADVRDVLIYRDIEEVVATGGLRTADRRPGRGFRPHLSLRSLPHGAVVATSSTRRAAQAREHRPDLQIVPIRGNVGTRLRKLAEQPGIDATLLAAAGLERLGFDLTPEGVLRGTDVPAGLAATAIAVTEMLPCVGQAAIGIEVRATDTRILEICARLNHAPTLTCVTAERAFLRAMGGGCQAAVGALAEWQGEVLRVRAVSFLDATPRRAERSGPGASAAALGAELARELGR